MWGKDGDDIWTITASKIDPAHYFGVTVANGMIGLVSSPQPLEVAQVIMNGAYDSVAPGEVCQILRTFNLASVDLRIDGENLAPDQIKSLRQTLDMKSGSLVSSFDWGTKATVTITRYALRQLPFTILVDVVILPHQEVTIDAGSLLGTSDDLKDAEFFTHEVPNLNAYSSTLLMLAAKGQSLGGGVKMGACTTVLFDANERAPELKHTSQSGNAHHLDFAFKLTAEHGFHFTIVGSTISSAQNSDPLNAARRNTLFAVLRGRNGLIEGNDRSWAELWKSDIIVDGDPHLQRDLHLMLFELYSFIRPEYGYSIGPDGLSGIDYHGHVFWDADTWMFPALVLLHPELGQSMLEYRYARLPAARANALAHGFHGAMFPWESAATGDQETPMPSVCGEFEQHITACVGIAAWKYYCVTRDKEWLKTRGWPLLSETADFWASRVERNGIGRYDIRRVVPADEQARDRDNDAFTNAAARENLRVAALAARELGLEPNPDWTRVRDNIPILHFPDGVTRETATYKGEKIQQADVNLLAYPLHEITDPAGIRRDLEYYSQHLGAGPAMTHSIFAIIRERLGEPGEAFKEFRLGFEPNLLPPFGVFTERADTEEGAVYFATGAGGVLQVMLNGFGGLEITDSGVVQLHTKLPSAWKSLTLTGIGPDRRTFVVGGSNHSQ